MEEDVEIKLLLESNEKILLEAAKETNMVKSKEIDQLEKCTSGLVEENKISQGKENITENMNNEHEETLYRLTEIVETPGITSQGNESNVNILTNQDVTNCSFESILKKQQHSLSSVYKGYNQEVSCTEKADDQVNQHILDLMATDPVKYYLSQQNSYISQFEEEGENESSDDDWEDDFGYTNDDLIGDKLAEPQYKTFQKSHFSGNESLHKIEAKAIPLMTTLGNMLLKRGNFLSALENKLQQLSQSNKNRQKEVQDALAEPDTIKAKEPYSSRCIFRKFGMPYFADENGFCAPPNKDHQEKLLKDEIMTEAIPKVISWIKPHKDMMKNAIKKALIEEQSAKLVKEITKLKTVLEEAAKKSTDKANKLQLEITEKQKELVGIGKKSFNELVLNENENREYDWMKFSVSLFNGLHSAEECKRFWHMYLKPTINKSAWSSSEDLKLLKIASQLKYQNWEKIAKLLGTNRSGFQCFVHYKAILEGKSDFSNGKWTQEEDNKLLTMINSSKIGDFIPWTKISSYMGNRNHNQIYNRWANSLNPELVKGRFSKEEDLLLLTGVEVFGVNFKQLASLMNNRTSSQLRERYERHLKPKSTKVGIWSLDEDKKLLALVEKYGAHNWSKISYEMKTRTRTQARQRYGFIQKMRKKKPGWTIAQVKRKNVPVSSNLNKTKKDMEYIKRDLEEVKKVFRITELEEETFLAQKLAELKDKILSRKPIKRGRKRKESVESSKVNDAILDLFTNCYTKSLTKTTKSLYNDIDGGLNELFLLSKFLGHKLMLPKSEKEVQNNPRLSFTSKSFLKCVLNTNPVDNSSRSLSKQQVCSGSYPNMGDSVIRIDHPIPDYDDTIIMMDWWHTPPVNVASLNFSEFFKRTVFDYSNGMHKDIWDSKVKRSTVVNISHDYSDNEQEEHPPSQNYLFPPNQFTALGIRSILLSRAILERQTRQMDDLEHVGYGYFKKEVDEDRSVDGNVSFDADDVIHKVCKQFQDNLLTLFTWPHFLSHTKVRTVPLEYVKSTPKKQEDMLGNVIGNSGTVLDGSKEGKENEQACSSTNSNSNSQKESVLEENQKHQFTIKRGRKMLTEHLVQKRKLDDKFLEAVKKRNPKSQKTPRSKCVKYSNTKGKTLLNGDKSSNLVVSQPLKSTRFTYSRKRKAKKRKSGNGQEPKDKCRSMELQYSDAGESSCE